MSSPAPGEPGWVPRLVALDIDGTLLAWVDGGGQTHEEVRPRVKEAVNRAVAAGARTHRTTRSESLASHTRRAFCRSPHAF